MHQSQNIISSVDWKSSRLSNCLYFYLNIFLGDFKEDETELIRNQYYQLSNLDVRLSGTDQ